LLNYSDTFTDDEEREIITGLLSKQRAACATIWTESCVPGTTAPMPDPPPPPPAPAPPPPPLPPPCPCPALLQRKQINMVEFRTQTSSEAKQS
jgi:hypothetical protein